LITAPGAMVDCCSEMILNLNFPGVLTDWGRALPVVVKARGHGLSADISGG